MKPSNFLAHPYDSVFHKMETEIVARNIMAILTRTGDSFRTMEWQEYEAERMKDGNLTHGEASQFEKVRDYCIDENVARLFLPAWRNNHV